MRACLLTKVSFNNYVGQILPRPPTPFKWTSMDILHTIYLLFMWSLVDFLMTTYLPLFVHVVIQWPQTPLPPWESDEFITENVFWANLVLCTIGKNRPWPPMEGMLLFFSVGRDSGVPNVAGFSRIGKNQRTTLIVDETNWFDIQRKDLRLEIE